MSKPAVRLLRGCGFDTDTSILFKKHDAYLSVLRRWLQLLYCCVKLHTRLPRVTMVSHDLPHNGTSNSKSEYHTVLYLYAKAPPLTASINVEKVARRRIHKAHRRNKYTHEQILRVVKVQRAQRCCKLRRAIRDSSSSITFCSHNKGPQAITAGIVLALTLLC